MESCNSRTRTHFLCRGRGCLLFLIRKSYHSVPPSPHYLPLQESYFSLSIVFLNSIPSHPLFIFAGQDQPNNTPMMYKIKNPFVWFTVSIFLHHSPDPPDQVVLTGSCCLFLIKRVLYSYGIVQEQQLQLEIKMRTCGAMGASSSSASGY